MIEALLNGKLSRDQENMEDILTSNVFGLLQYVSPSSGLFPFLAQAITVDEEHPLADLTEEMDIPRGHVKYSFWPRWEGCEPDLVIAISLESRLSRLVAIEAKYRSGKSSKPEKDVDRPHDQLAREWTALHKEAEDARSQPFLVYLTADLTLPRREIEASLADCQQNGAFPPNRHICWLTWRHFPRLFGDSEEPILGRLSRLIGERLGLTFFQGVSYVSPITADWQFTR